MLEFPKWFDKALNVIECPKCEKKIEKKHIIAEGIRKSIVKGRDTAFFIEYKCPKCESHSTIELVKMDVEGFVMEMIDILTTKEDFGTLEKEEYETEEGLEEGLEAKDYKKDIEETNDKTSNTLPGAEKVKIKSKITSSEFDMAIKMIRNCETHDDFMSSIGITQEDIKNILSENEDKPKQKPKREVKKKTKKNKRKKDKDNENQK